MYRASRMHERRMFSRFRSLIWLAAALSMSSILASILGNLVIGAVVLSTSLAAILRISEPCEWGRRGVGEGGGMRVRGMLAERRRKTVGREGKRPDHGRAHARGVARREAARAGRLPPLRHVGVTHHRDSNPRPLLSGLEPGATSPEVDPKKCMRGKGGQGRRGTVSAGAARVTHLSKEVEEAPQLAKLDGLPRVSDELCAQELIPRFISEGCWLPLDGKLSH